jgi:hypothetical protein
MADLIIGQYAGVSKAAQIHDVKFYESTEYDSASLDLIDAFLYAFESGEEVARRGRAIISLSAGISFMI